MRWLWRKSIKMGPFKTTLSQRGVGWSIGIPGLRYGISPTGRRYLSIGIPGTGLYGIKYFDADLTGVPAPKPPAIPKSPEAEKWWTQKHLS